jgi:farnesyl diphosphate synthase
MSFADRLPAYRDRAESALEHWLPPATTHPPRFHAAIRYSVLAGGKRLRPVLVYAAGEWLGIAPERLDPIAVAIELVHAYALVHDDLPAMDDDALRRGRPTTHRAFDEATAILVGDALQAHAYDVLATDERLQAGPETRRQLLVDLARASGSEGMAGGQAFDMTAAAGITAEELEAVYALKTGRLLRAAVLMPTRLAPPLDPQVLAAVERFTLALGVAYQVADDLLGASGGQRDVEGAEPRSRKATLLTVLGAEAARRRLEALHAEARAALTDLHGATGGLRYVCDWACNRSA